MFLPMSYFSDAALRQMETIRPMSDDEFTTIDGVGKQN
jgi:ATP-dependent DNA helicase RecQ